MNPIERDLRNYFGVDYGDGDILEHYGTKRHSGRFHGAAVRRLISTPVTFCPVWNS